MTPLQHLLDRVEKAEALDEPLFLAVVRHLLGPRWMRGDWGRRVTRYWIAEAWEQIALALVERCLPGWTWGVTGPLKDDEGNAWFNGFVMSPEERPDGHDTFDAAAKAAAPSILCALLKALIAQGGEGSSVARAESDGSAVRTETPRSAGGGSR